MMKRGITEKSSPMSLLNTCISGVIGESTSQNVNTAAMWKSLIILVQNGLKRTVIKILDRVTASIHIIIK